MEKCPNCSFGVLTELDGEKKCLMCMLFDAPFVFWTCPKGCRGTVEWNEDKTDAECGKCGLKKSEAKALQSENDDL